MCLLEEFECGGNFSNELLIFTKKNRGPEIDPWGIPAFTGSQFDNCPFSVTRWNCY